MHGTQHTPTSIAVFCGSSTGAHPIYTQAATAVGQAPVRRNIRLVYGLIR